LRRKKEASDWMTRIAEPALFSTNTESERFKFPSFSSTTVISFCSARNRVANVVDPGGMKKRECDGFCDFPSASLFLTTVTFWRSFEEARWAKHIPLQAFSSKTAFDSSNEEHDEFPAKIAVPFIILFLKKRRLRKLIAPSTWSDAQKSISTIDRKRFDFRTQSWNTKLSNETSIVLKHDSVRSSKRKMGHLPYKKNPVIGRTSEIRSLSWIWKRRRRCFATLWKSAQSQIPIKDRPFGGRDEGLRVEQKNVSSFCTVHNGLQIVFDIFQEGVRDRPRSGFFIERYTFDFIFQSTRTDFWNSL